MLLLVAKSYGQIPLVHPRIGVLVTPENGAVPGPIWAADNGAFSGFDERMFRLMLERLRRYPGCLFVTAPDVVGDHQATLQLWPHWSEVIRGVGYPPAFVLQDGCDRAPSDAEALFIGGTTHWKLSEQARSLVEGDPRHTHMGRVNSHRRARLAHAWGIDSIDGSTMTWFTDQKLLGLLEASEHQQGVFDSAKGAVRDD